MTVEPDTCLICGKPVPDYAPEFCCKRVTFGTDCGCQGRPTNPCVCSKECDKALFDGIGFPMEQRRINAKIPKYETP